MALVVPAELAESAAVRAATATAAARAFTAVFDQNGELNCMEGPDMIIELTDDAVPFYVNGSRPLPFANRPVVKRLLDEYVEKKIMVPVTEPSDWAAPLVAVVTYMCGPHTIESLRPTTHASHENPPRCSGRNFR